MNWKPVVGFCGIYEVSETGLIRRVAAGRGARSGRLISTKRINSKGYEIAELSANNNKIRIFVHRIVCSAFHGPPATDRLVVNHKDGNKRNNRCDNLEWVTIGQNNAHAWKTGLNHGLKKELNGRAKITQEIANEIRSLKGILGARVIAVRFNISRTTVQHIHQGLKWL